MKKVLMLMVALVAIIALPLGAQEKKEMAKEAMPSMMPPKALDDDFLKWFVGEWEGTTTMAEGTSKDWQKAEMSLDGQFLTTHATSQSPVSMYKGMGPLTINPATGEYVGYWFDNWRGTYKGVGKREGNKVTMRWESPMGITRDEITEKVSDDKMVVDFKMTMPDGSVMEGRSEMTRKKMMHAK